LSAKTTSYRPEGFLDRLEGNKHIVMLYDDEKRADHIIARYFTGGFERGGSCVFVTEEDPVAIRRRLVAQGIDVSGYEKENRLRIFQTPTPDSGEVDELKTMKAATAESTRGMKSPFRFVGRTIADIESMGGMLQGMNLETIGNDHFEEFDISLLCHYDIRKMERSRRGEWVRGLLENHQSVIYASDAGKAVAFETALLEEE
jgi:hypothetical protein